MKFLSYLILPLTLVTLALISSPDTLSVSAIRAIHPGAPDKSQTSNTDNSKTADESAEKDVSDDQNHLDAIGLVPLLSAFNLDLEPEELVNALNESELESAAMGGVRALISSTGCLSNPFSSDPPRPTEVYETAKNGVRAIRNQAQSGVILKEFTNFLSSSPSSPGEMAKALGRVVTKDVLNPLEFSDLMVAEEIESVEGAVISLRNLNCGNLYGVLRDLWGLPFRHILFGLLVGIAGSGIIGHLVSTVVTYLVRLHNGLSNPPNTGISDMIIEG